MSRAGAPGTCSPLDWSTPDPLRVLALLKTALREHLEVVLRFEGAVPLTWSRLVSKDRAGLVRAMLEAMLGRDPSITASWTLRGLVRPLEDREMLLGFVGQAGVEGARLVAGAPRAAGLALGSWAGISLRCRVEIRG